MRMEDSRCAQGKFAACGQKISRLNCDLQANPLNPPQGDLFPSLMGRG
jgi:hypothetical protein